MHSRSRFRIARPVSDMNAGQLSPSLLERVDRLALAPGGGGRKEAEDSLEGESSGAEERLPDLSSLVRFSLGAEW